MTRVVVYGAGRLGQAIIAAAETDSESQVKVVAAVDQHLVETRGEDASSVPLYRSLKEASAASDFDVVIDSSRADALDEVLEFVVENGKPLVIAATGHSAEQVEQIRRAAEVVPLLRSSNLSLGVNVLRRLVENAGAMLGPVDAEVVEAHHRLKVDAPSGTALTLAEAIRDSTDPSRQFVYGRRPDEVGARGDEIGVHSVRGGTVVGEHTVTFLLNDEIVELRHVAQSRDVFGFGALRAAAFVAGSPAGFYTMEDLLG